MSIWIWTISRCWKATLQYGRESDDMQKGGEETVHLIFTNIGVGFIATEHELAGWEKRSQIHNGGCTSLHRFLEEKTRKDQNRWTSASSTLPPPCPNGRHFFSRLYQAMSLASCDWAIAWPRPHSFFFTTKQNFVSRTRSCCILPASQNKCNFRIQNLSHKEYNFD
jgi:hypothetical protein